MLTFLFFLMEKGAYSAYSFSPCSLPWQLFHDFKKIPFILFFFFSFLCTAAPVAYGNSQASGLIGAAAASLYYSQGNTKCEPHLQPIPRLAAKLYP